MPELSPTAFEVLQVAVRLARDRQVKTLSLLRVRLRFLFPAREADIDQAIAFWAAHVQRVGVPA